MKILCLIGLLAGFPAVVTLLHADGSVGQFARHADIGAPSVAGSTAYDPTLQNYRMSAGGTNIWNSPDQFQFAWNRIKGDFIVRARVEFVGAAGDPHRKFGWMARSSSTADSPYVDACVHGNGLASLQFRRIRGGATEEIAQTLRGGDVIQLERRGHTYIFSSARSGETFASTTLTDLDLGDEAEVGLFLCAHSPAAKEEAIFKDVRIIIPPKAGYQPYRDYIGSHLEILDVHTGRLETVYSSPEQFEAPNWLPDGRTLIVNVSGPGPRKGHLMNFDLATRTMTPLNTGDAGHNNNDHVPSFDGKRLGISNHTAADGNRSVIFTLPAAGGEPVRVTAKSPSYLHGWSPDGQWLVFTGGRKVAENGPDKYDIYKIRATGGEEIRLTDSPGLSDGPEYSPDGRYIYYCSTRTGRMQLWRMKPDGSDQTQLTDDGFNNWFAHVSPDNRWIVFLSFGPEVKADDHPYYQQVYLRMIPVGGGQPRVIAYVFGGQGTINVPSWSPDCRHIAFVSNTGGLK